MDPAATKRVLSKAYNDPSSKGSLGGIERLFRAVKRHGISREQVKAFLASQDAYTLHKPARRNYARRKTIVSGVDAQWQADLVDMANLARFNRGTRYILTVIDCFSRYAWAVPVDKKNGESIARAFKTLFDSSRGRKPVRLQTDKGKEFYNPQVKAVLEANGVKLFSTHSETKASMVERFNRTLKQRMWTYFTANNTRYFLDVLPKLVAAYNKSQHRMLGTTPERASRKDNEGKLWQKQFAQYFATESKQRPKTKIQKGSEARISRQKATFEKGYLPNWTEEHFRVKDISDGPGPRVYKAEDAVGEPIQGIFYQEEIQAINPKLESDSSVYRIERILRKQFRGQSNERWFIKWLGWPEKFNSWILASDALQAK